MAEGTLVTSENRLEQLGAVLPRGHRVLIIPHDFPDPDALAAASALHVLLDKKFGMHSQIAFSGEVSRAENKELLRRLCCRWHRLSDLNNKGAGMYCILVDTAPWSRNVTLPRGAKVLAVLDHHEHRVSSAKQPPFCDIRAGTGATTTIAFEYLKAAGLEPPRWLAAIMAYAIVSETLDLSRETATDDLRAYSELVAHADLRVVGKIRHAPLVRSYYARLQEALSEARVLGSVVWTHLSHIEQPEIVAEVADLLLRMEGARWSFCTAHMSGRIFVSIRSNKAGARCSRILRSAIGRNGAAGGHDQMAAGYLEVGSATGFDREEKRMDLARTLVRHMVRRVPEGRDAVDLLSERLVD
jgi:nanoRNase/pAp phosphatase (c-di-AMP/oligoRNAs hydrolase)